jgi:superfamily II DNA/RNA helicase
MLIPTFASLGVSDAVSSTLAARGVASPFPVQLRVIPDALAGRDVLVRSPTGSGKSLAFGIPLVERIAATDPRPSALVLAPTRELASQIVEELRDIAHVRALGIAAVYGGAGIHKQARLAAKAHILVATPGRLEDLIERGEISLRHVRVLVLDEADRMLDMGFKPPVDRIVRQTQRERQTLLFSATLDAEVATLARAYTNNAVRHEQDQTRERRGDIEHRFVRVAHEGKLDALVHELGHADRGRTLVFVRTKRGADRLVKRLTAHDVDAVAMHGDKTQGQRERALDRFTRGETDLLIATDVAARGLDVDGITHVINFDAPEQREDYVHRVGRTGRAGATGVGITFVTADQARDVARIAGELGLDTPFAAGSGGTSPSAARRSKAPRGNGPRRDTRADRSGSARLVASARPGRHSRGRRQSST